MYIYLFAVSVHLVCHSPDILLASKIIKPAFDILVWRE